MWLLSPHCDRSACFEDVNCHMMSTILGAMHPAVVTLLLGFVAGWHQDFDSEWTSVLTAWSCSTRYRSVLRQQDWNVAWRST